MEVEPSDIGVGLMMTGFGFAGLFLAAGARDDAMYVFGLSLMGFAFVFVLGLIRRVYERAPAYATPVMFARDAAPVVALQPAKVLAHV